MTHIDEWCEDLDNDAYATWVFAYFRLPAVHKNRWWRFMKAHPLFCTYCGKPYRVTGASRMGDVWLATSVTREMGYDLRVDVTLCSEWRATPEVLNVSPMHFRQQGDGMTECRCERGKDH